MKVWPFSANRWPFEDPETAQTLTVRQVVLRKEPILQAYHLEDEGMWQFSVEAVFPERDVVMVTLRQVYDIDPSIGELADLPLGWEASREALGAPWRRQPSE